MATSPVAALLLATATIVVSTPAYALPARDPSAPTPAASATATAGPAAQAAPGVKVPDFATQAWVLADMDSGAILAQLNPHLQLRPASTQKLLTALTVAPRLHPDQLYRADKADETAEGNRVVLHAGLDYKVSDLLHAALLPSANDAAMALARANGGAEQTVAQMNAEAARLGATDTRVANPSGLDADGQLSSAHDLAVIGRAAMANPEIASYLKLTKADFPGKKNPDGSRVVYPIYNHNTMLRSFPGALGGKSGYTTLARRTMVAAAQREDRRLVVSLLNIGGNTYRTAEQVLAWGFAHADELAAVGKLPDPAAPAPTFDRVAAEQPVTGKAKPAGSEGAAADDRTSDVAPAPAAAAATSDQDSGSTGGYWQLTLMTVLMAMLAAARARVYWLGHTRRRRAAQAALAARRSSRLGASQPSPQGGDGTPGRWLVPSNR